MCRLTLPCVALLCGLACSTAWAEDPVTADTKSFSFQVLLADGNLAESSRDNVTAERILGLVNEGKMDRVSRIQFPALENQPTTLQFGEQVPVVTSRSSQPRGRGEGFTEAITYMQKGTLVNLTARVEDGGAIIAEFSLERTEIVAAESAQEGDQSDPNRFRPARTITNQLKNTIRLTPGEPLVVSGRQMNGPEKGTQTWVLVTAKVVDKTGGEQAGKQSSGGGFF